MEVLQNIQVLTALKVPDRILDRFHEFLEIIDLRFQERQFNDSNYHLGKVYLIKTKISRFFPCFPLEIYFTMLYYYLSNLKKSG